MMYTRTSGTNCEKSSSKISLYRGISSTSDFKNSNLNLSNEERQWDFPYAWAPHQILIWQELLNYGFKEKANELIYRWL